MKLNLKVENDALIPTKPLKELGKNEILLLTLNQLLWVEFKEIKENTIIYVDNEGFEGDEPIEKEIADLVEKGLHYYTGECIYDSRALEEWISTKWDLEHFLRGIEIGAFDKTYIYEEEDKKIIERKIKELNI